MQIRPTSNTQSTQSVNLQPKTASTSATDGAATALPVDQLDISPQAQMISGATGSADVRFERVAQIRAQIAEGNYDTNDKMNAAVGRLLDQIG